MLDLMGGPGGGGARGAVQACFLGLGRPSTSGAFCPLCRQEALWQSAYLNVGHRTPSVMILFFFLCFCYYFPNSLDVCRSRRRRNRVPLVGLSPQVRPPRCTQFHVCEGVCHPDLAGCCCCTEQSSFEAPRGNGFGGDK